MSSENLCTAPSLTTIEAAIGEIDVKKAELKKAFDDLQALSSHLSSFSISWSDVESYFAARQDSLVERFRFLQLSKQGDPSASKTRQDQIDPVSESTEQPSSSNPVRLQLEGSDAPGSSRIDSVVARPELKELCERMDGKRLLKYIDEHTSERDAIRMELPSALRSAPDPGAMVLDAIEGFYSENPQSKGDKDPELSGSRRVCMFLLEILMEAGVSYSEKVRERAKKLASEWKGKVRRMKKDYCLESLAFLHLVATYGLGTEVDKDDLVDFLFNAARYREATMLCRSIDLGEKIHDLIQKLLDNTKQQLAVRFVFEFGLTNKYPPVPLLEDYLRETKTLAEQVCKDGKNSLRSLNEATAKEVGALKTVIKIIEQHKLETEYSPESLQKRIEQLEKQQANRKNRATPTVVKPQQVLAIHEASHQVKKKKQAHGKQQHSGSNKHPKTTASVIHAAPSLGVAGSSLAVPQFQQSHLQPSGLLPDHSASFLSSSAGPYGMAASSVNPYGGPSAAIYAAPPGFSVNPNPAAPPGFSMNPSPSASQLYSYERVPNYGSYGLPPQYHPSYRHPR